MADTLVTAEFLPQQAHIQDVKSERRAINEQALLYAK
jgi:hypothetical protein